MKLKWWHWVGGGVLGLLIVGALSDPPKAGNSVDAAASPAATPSPTSQPTPAAIAATAEELGKAYDENELTARDKFEGRPLRVTGTILNISSVLGEPTLSLQSTHMLQATFADAAPLKMLKSGQRVTITCEGLTEALSVLGLKGCVLR